MFLASIGTCESLSKSTATLLANSTDAVTGIIACVASTPPIGNRFLPYRVANFSMAYLLISLLLNVLLTLMIVIRLALHSKNIRNAVGSTVEAGRLCKSIISMLIESCALYAGTFLVCIVSWYTRDTAVGYAIWMVFQPILEEIQVRVTLARILEHSNLTMIRTGHRSVPHHSTGRRPDRGDKERNRLRGSGFDQVQESRAVDGL